ncbi:glutathione S-transferase family protein [Sphingomonas profundi]|uniref:glutathione S-transferase family protein n=1 Tax=Alterirhizorhabdus profundi TaxID=2681549 RepID=UPI0012E9277E|nr:glutathione S-transferase family protein [Sphingomonas profundi]
MADTLTLYTNPMSRGRIARWMLEEVGQPYEVVNLDFTGSMKTADYLAINPMGKVPAIRHGDTVVTEVAAICAYLADAFPDANLAPPPGDAARGPYYRWLFFGAGPLEAAVIDKSLGVTIPEDKKAMVGYRDFATMIDTVEKAVSGDGWLAGDRFSAADLYIGAHLMWGTMFGSIEKRPAFEAFIARLAERPAHQRATALDDAAMPKQDG